MGNCQISVRSSSSCDFMKKDGPGRPNSIEFSRRAAAGHDGEATGHRPDAAACHGPRTAKGDRPARGRPPSERENAPRWSATSCSPTDSLRSTIGAGGLNFRVRNGTGCTSPAMVADQRGAFCCQGPARPGPQGRTARNGNKRDRARRRVTHRHLGSRVMEELGLLVTLG